MTTCIVVALPAEARPLIAHHRLRRRSSAPFPIYEGDTVRLTVSGVGRRAAADATACLQAHRQATHPAVWLNVGIVGHRTHALGEALLAHRIREQASARSWYPPLLFDVPCATGNLLTVEHPQSCYPDGWAIDMEAAGFYRSACRGASAELVQVVKVVSDNAANPPARINAKTVAQLIESKLGLIDAIADTLHALATALPRAAVEEEALVPFTKRWHFTVSQQHRLRHLLSRWRVLAHGQDLWCKELRCAAQGAEVLRHLERRLRALPVRLAKTTP